MSAKSKAKKVGLWLLKYVGPQALYFVVDKYAGKREAAAVRGFLDAFVKRQPLAPKLQGIVDDFMANTPPDSPAKNVAHLRGLLGGDLGKQASALRGKK